MKKSDSPNRFMLRRELRKHPPIRNKTEYSAKGNAVIHAYLKDIDHAENPYNPSRLSEDLGDYLVSETLFCTSTCPVELKVHLSTPAAEEKKSWLKQALTEYAERSRTREHAKMTGERVVGVILLALALLSMTTAILFNVNFERENTIIETIFSVMSWFFIWEGIDRLILSGNTHKLRLAALLKLKLSEIEFITEEK